VVRLLAATQLPLLPNQPPPLIIESFAKKLVEDVLRDAHIRREGAAFIEHISKKDVVLEAIVDLLVKAAQDPRFLNETTGLAKRLTHEVLTDKELKQEAVALFVNLVQNPEVKSEMQDLIKWLCEQEPIKKELVELCMDSFQHTKLLSAVKELMAGAFYELLLEKETEEKLKLFSFYLLETEKGGKDKTSLKDKSSGKVQNDLVSEKVAKGHQGESKDSEFKRVLKGEGNEDVLESISERRKSAPQPGDDEKKKYFFF